MSHKEAQLGTMKFLLYSSPLLLVLVRRTVGIVVDESGLHGSTDGYEGACVHDRIVAKVHCGSEPLQGADVGRSSHGVHDDVKALLEDRASSEAFVAQEILERG